MTDPDLVLIQEADIYERVDRIERLRSELEIERLRSELEIVRGTAEHYRNLWRARGDLLRDADAALKDLGACDTPDCSEPACLKVRHRIQLDLAALDPAAARAVD